MKVAYVLGNLNRGGAEVLLLDLFKNNNDNLYESILIHRKKGRLEEEFIATGKPMFYLPMHNLISYLVQLRKVIISQKASFVHTNQSLDSILIKIAIVFTKVKLVQTVHSFDTGIKLPMKLLRLISLNIANKNIFVSKTQLDYYKNHYWMYKDSSIIYNGLDTQKFNKDKSKSFRRALQLEDNVLLMGTVGNFSSGRDQLTICRFLNDINKLNIDFYFCFVGAQVHSIPDFYDVCVNYVNNNKLASKVNFLGVRDDVATILSSFDLYIYSSEHDTFGISVVEAMISQVQVMVNDWMVMREITEEGKLAILYKTKDIEDMVSKFLLFINNQKKYTSQLEQISQYVSDKYGMKSYSTKLTEVYDSIL